ncbi:MAG: DUF1269 domain-containing protein [Rhodospirillales bacterium]|jgi:uncharacterized membrane protein|nr:DUF1269 domain-containing protein [Rhodospirillales bacterium]
MSDLVAICFNGRDTAERVLADLKHMQKEYVVELADACIVTRDEKGHLQLHQLVNTVASGAVGGAAWGGLWGALIGLLFLNPIVGFALGAAAGAAGGALGGKLADYGINDDFIKQLGDAVTADCSALFVLFRKVTLDRVLPDLEQYQGKVLRTSLTLEQEQELRKALAAHVAAA